jgi:hypothetical protein
MIFIYPPKQRRYGEMSDLCKFHNDSSKQRGCRGFCETKKEIDMNLCADCLEAYLDNQTKEVKRISVLKIADDSGLLDMLPTNLVGVMVNNSLQAFADSLTKDRDAEIERLKVHQEKMSKMATPSREQVRNLETLLTCKSTQIKEQSKEIGQLNTKVAMMRKVLKDKRSHSNFCSYGFIFNDKSPAVSKCTCHLQEALSTTETDVQCYLNDVKADALEEAVGLTTVEIMDYAKRLRGEQV